jgi:hypothetical protein
VTIPRDARIVCAKQQVSCDLAGEAAILNLQSGVYFGLDPVGARIWKLIQEPKTLDELRDTLLSEYDVEETRLDADLARLLGEMAKSGLVEIQK